MTPSRLLTLFNNLDLDKLNGAGFATTSFYKKGRPRIFSTTCAAITSAAWAISILLELPWRQAQLSGRLQCQQRILGPRWNIAGKHHRRVFGKKQRLAQRGNGVGGHLTPLCWKKRQNRSQLPGAVGGHHGGASG